MRAAVGWTVDRDEVLASGERVSDEWAIVGQVITADDDERFRTQRSWLRGARSGRDALVLQFAAGTAPFPEALVPGMVLDAEMALWPSAHPLRALVSERRGEMKPLTSRPGAPAGPAGIDGLLESYAQALGRQPWIERFPAALGAVVPALAGDPASPKGISPVEGVSVVGCHRRPPVQTGDRRCFRCLKLGTPCTEGQDRPVANHILERRSGPRQCKVEREWLAVTPQRRARRT